MREELKDELEIGLADVVVTDPDNSLLRPMNGAIGTGPGLSRIRFSQNVINGTLIEDALIYRLNLKAA